jgi:hypothetical protein
VDTKPDKRTRRTFPTPDRRRSTSSYAARGEQVDAGVWPLGTEPKDTSHSGPAVSGVVVISSQVLRLAVAAYLARFKGQSRVHTESDLRGYLLWCESRQLDPLAATRPHIELYVRWLQEVRRYRPSTVSRRVSVLAGFYRTCVIDGALEHSPPTTSADPTCRRSPRPWD